MSEPDIAIGILCGIPADKSDQRAIGLVKYEPPPKAVKVACQLCARECWIGERQQRLAALGVAVVCARCVISDGGGSNAQSLGGQSGEFLV